MTRRRQALVAVMLLALGAGGLWLLKNNRTPAERREMAAPPRLVESLTVTPGPYLPRVSGFGAVRPAREWRLLARVAGELVAIHPAFETGGRIPAGEVIARQDDAALTHQAARQRQVVAETEAVLEELERQQRLDREQLALDQRQTALAARELERAQQLLEQGSAPATARDLAEGQWMTRRAVLLERQQRVDTFPLRQRQLQARLAAARELLAELERQLADTRLALPHPVRVNSRAVSVGQYLSPGTELGRVHDPRELEIDVALSPPQVALLRPPGEESPWPAEGIPAVITWHARQPPHHWQGRATRLAAALDPASRTRTVTVVVRDPEPPLLPGSYVEVTLSGAPRPGVVAVPRDLLQEGAVLVVENGQLARRPVTVATMTGDVALVTAGLAPGDTLLATPTPGAYPGMTVRTVNGTTPPGDAPPPPQ